MSSQEDVIVHFLQAFIESLQILSVFRKRDAGFQLEEYHLAGTDGVSGKNHLVGVVDEYHAARRMARKLHYFNAAAAQINHCAVGNVQDSIVVDVSSGEHGLFHDFQYVFFFGGQVDRLKFIRMVHVVAMAVGQGKLQRQMGDFPDPGGYCFRAEACVDDQGRPASFHHIEGASRIILQLKDAGADHVNPVALPFASEKHPVQNLLLFQQLFSCHFRLLGIKHSFVSCRPEAPCQGQASVEQLALFRPYLSACRTVAVVFPA